MILHVTVAGKTMNICETMINMENFIKTCVELKVCITLISGSTYAFSFCNSLLNQEIRSWNLYNIWPENGSKGMWMMGFVMKEYGIGGFL